jgi:hypothetical protein
MLRQAGNFVIDAPNLFDHNPAFPRTKPRKGRRKGDKATACRVCLGAAMGSPLLLPNASNCTSSRRGTATHSLVRNTLRSIEPICETTTFPGPISSMDNPHREAHHGRRESPFRQRNEIRDDHAESGKSKTCGPTTLAQRACGRQPGVAAQRLP